MKIKNASMVNGFDVDGEPKELECKACITAKETRCLFPKVAECKTIRPGELTHTDVWGPEWNPTTSGMRFFMTFIDDYT